MKEYLISLLSFFGLAFWVEISTESPRCTYYFGPFFTAKEANSEAAGYVEDLQQESAQGIQVLIKRCKPTTLTVSEDLGEIREARRVPVFSGQP